jgi:hypothetical protein
MNVLTAVASPPYGRSGVRLAGIKRLMRTSYRLQLYSSDCIYEVVWPRYALRCFATPVETWSSPKLYQYTPFRGSPAVFKRPWPVNVWRVPVPAVPAGCR